MIERVSHGLELVLEKNLSLREVEVFLLFFNLSTKLNNKDVCIALNRNIKSVSKYMKSLERKKLIKCTELVDNNEKIYELKI